MEAKFTIQDILVYFLSGLGFIVFVLPIFINHAPEDFKLEEVIENIPSAVFLFAVPIIYLLGHIIDGFDALRIVLISFFQKTRKNKFLNSFNNIMFTILAGDRITGAIYKKSKASPGDVFKVQFDEYWHKVNYIQVQDKYKYCEYNEVLKNLFNALQVALLLCLTLAAFYNEWRYFIGYSIVLMLFWIKSKHYTEELIGAVEMTYSILKEQKQLDNHTSTAQKPETHNPAP